MTSGPDRQSYSDRVSRQLIRYAELQREDIVEGIQETARLSGELYNDALAGSGESELVSAWTELWSAFAHYTAAIAANFGMLIAGLGYEIKLGKTDGVRPARVMRLPLGAVPKCIGAWMIGEGPWQQSKLDVSRVTLHQTAAQIGSGDWTVTFDLSGKPQPARGVYCLQLDIGNGVLDPFERRFYLDPHVP